MIGMIYKDREEWLESLIPEERGAVKDVIGDIHAWGYTRTPVIYLEETGKSYAAKSRKVPDLDVVRNFLKGDHQIILRSLVRAGFGYDGGYIIRYIDLEEQAPLREVPFDEWFD